MNQFVQSLESRQLLSGSVSQVIDEAAVALDVHGLIADAKSAKTTLTADGTAVAAQLKSLDLRNTALGRSLAGAINTGRRKISADVAKIVSAGTVDGRAVFNDWVRVEFKDGSDSAKLAKDQTKLAADVNKLWKVEQPFIAKFQTDFSTAETNIENAVQAIVNANKSDAALSTAWTTLQGDIDSATKTLSGDFTQLTTDVDRLIADL